MKVVIACLMLAIPAVELNAAEVPEFSNATAAQLTPHLNHTVSLTGILYNGVQGLGLRGATAKGTAFYLKPTVPEGGFTYPKELMKLVGTKVTVMGELKFISYPDRTGQVPPDHFYMILQTAKITIAK